MTRDLDTVAFYLDWIENDPQNLMGTNIGAALKNALEVARKDDRQTRKIFVLLSDGEDYGGEVNRQLAVYRQEGHHINSIGRRRNNSPRRNIALVACAHHHEHAPVSRSLRRPGNHRSLAIHLLLGIVHVTQVEVVIPQR